MHLDNQDPFTQQESEEVMDQMSKLPNSDEDAIISSLSLHNMITMILWC